MNFANFELRKGDIATSAPIPTEIAVFTIVEEGEDIGYQIL